MENQDPELQSEGAEPAGPKVVVSNNDIKIGLFFDPDSVAVLLETARAAHVNAQVLLSIADTFSAGRLDIGSAMSIHADAVLIADNKITQE